MKKVEQMKNVLDIRKSRVALISVVLATVALSGCSYNTKDFNSVPDFSPVRADLGYAPSMNPDIYPTKPKESKYSLYRSSSNSFYRDPRAMKPGDVLTVQILINDRANLNNKSDLKRDANGKYTLGATYPLIGKNGGSVNGDSTAHSKGDAKVERKEDIKLSVAAVVTDVLPNGNLVINGSQEVRVNYELRVLNVAGVVRPRDITGNNTIEYNKIAEARISYGGRGRMSEIQQPPYGQQIMNQISPF